LFVAVVLWNTNAITIEKKIQLRAQHLERWCNKPASLTMDGTFAVPATLATSKVVLKCASAEQQATLVHIATNSIQCCWQLQPDGATRKLQPLWCATCNAAATLTHLVDCTHASAIGFRCVQRDALHEVLSSEASSAAWLAPRQRLSFTQLLLQLFPRPPSIPLPQHSAHVLCGVFCEGAADAVGITRVKDARRFMRELLLLCIDGVRVHYHNLKSALP
jgi:hypothetical protein